MTYYKPTPLFRADFARFLVKVVAYAHLYCVRTLP